MKKLLGIVVLSLFCCNITLADKYVGKGEIKLSDHVVNYFMQYIRLTTNTPGTFYITEDGLDLDYWTCPYGQCQPPHKSYETKQCEIRYQKPCKLFAQRRTIKWKNGINPGKGKASRFSSKMSDSEVIAKLTQLGFYGNTTTLKEIEKKETNKVEKKKEEPKKVVKKYELKGERSIALSWEGYEDLIAGTVEFDEADYKGTLNLALPNNDGTCDGTYSLQKGGKGTWQIACTNNLGAAGTLKWLKDGGVTGTGRDHNDKKVKFTVSKKS